MTAIENKGGLKKKKSYIFGQYDTNTSTVLGLRGCVKFS